MNLTSYERRLIAEALRVYVEHLKYIPKRYEYIRHRAQEAEALALRLDPSWED